MSVRRPSNEPVGRDSMPWWVFHGGVSLGPVAVLVATGRELAAGLVGGALLLGGIWHAWTLHLTRRTAVLPAAETMSVEESLTLEVSADVVWALMEPAENAPLLNPDLVRGFEVPGTPTGLGRQQCLVHEDGRECVVEVVEHVPGRLAVFKQVSPDAGSLRMSTRVEPLEQGCLLIIGIELDPAGGLALDESLARATLQECLAQVQRALATCVVTGERAGTTSPPP